MFRVVTLRLVLLAALLLALVRVVVVRSAHVGPVEWVVVVALAATLVAALVAHLRRAA
jgi:hypothetical protein